MKPASSKTNNTKAATGTAPRAGRDWYRSFFKNPFYNPATPKMLAKAPGEAGFVLRQLKLGPGAALLDLCCGPGRHALEFARNGLAVTGVDLSAEYLAEARALAKKSGLRARFLRGDMRRLRFNGEFDAAVNLFNSFGYFLDRADDLETLRGVARALKPDGLFLIDIVHGPFVRKNFIPRSWMDAGEFLHLEQAELDGDGIHNTWRRYPKAGGEVVARTFYGRLYDRESLSAALRQAGLSPVRFWGGYGGEPLSVNRKQMLCLARKA